MNSKSLLILSLFIVSSCTQKISGPDLFSVQLSTLDHQQFSLRELSKNKASVILFLQPECPLCNSYGKTMHALDSVYAEKNIPIYGVVAGKNYPDEEIKAFLDKHHINFTTLLDPDFRLKNTLHARVT